MANVNLQRLVRVMCLVGASAMASLHSEAQTHDEVSPVLDGVDSLHSELPSWLRPVPCDSLSVLESTPGLPEAPTIYAPLHHYDIVSWPSFSPAFTSPGLIYGSEPASSWRWSVGGYSSSAHMPGLMGIESGGFNTTAAIGALTLDLWGGIDRVGSFRSVSKGWSVGGSLDYALSPQWIVTLFGSYGTGITAPTAAMAAFLPQTYFGGIVTYRISDRWSLGLGAQTTRSQFNGRWITRPMVVPTYHFSKSVSVSLDVGGIVHGIVTEYVNSRNHGRGPVIAPERGGPLPVGPRN